MTIQDVVIRSTTNEDRDRIKALVFGVLAEYGLAPDPSSTDADLDDIEANYIQAGGLFEVIEDGRGELLGTVGLYRLDAQRCELRKMYLIRPARGHGLGRSILQRTLSQAQARGFKTVVLETASVLKEAIHLYTRSGFQKIDAPHLSARCDQAYVLHLDTLPSPPPGAAPGHNPSS